MGRATLRAPAIAIATCLLVIAACRSDEPAPASSESESGASEGIEGSSSGEAEPTLCPPGQARACYEGPPGTEGVGACAAGQQQCAADGSAWSACVEQVWPEPQERCDTPADDDCDGLTLCEPTLEWWQAHPRWVNGLVPREDGGVVLVGMYGDAEFDGKDDGLFVRALDAQGRLVWERTGTPPSYQWPSAVAVDPAGDIVVAGSYLGAPSLGGPRLPAAAGYSAFAVRYTSAGEHVWSHAIDSDSYIAAAVDDAGTTYLVGGSIATDEIRGPLAGEFFLTAIDGTGALSWIQVGHASFGVYEGTAALAVTETQELALLLASGGTDLELGGMRMPSDGYEPFLVRMALDGTPLGYQRLTQGVPWAVGAVQVFARPGGLMTISNVGTTIDGLSQAGLLMVGFDTAFDPISSSFVVGQNIGLQAAALHPDGTTVFATRFTGLLELGPIGVGVQGGVYGTAFAAVDDAGNARWAEVLYSNTYTEAPAVTAAPDGAVYFLADVYSGAVIDEVSVNGMIVGKLRP